MVCFQYELCLEFIIVKGKLRCEVWGRWSLYPLNGSWPWFLRTLRIRKLSESAKWLRLWSGSSLKPQIIHLIRLRYLKQKDDNFGRGQVLAYSRRMREPTEIRGLLKLLSWAKLAHWPLMPFLYAGIHCCRIISYKLLCCLPLVSWTYYFQHLCILYRHIYIFFNWTTEGDRHIFSS